MGTLIKKRQIENLAINSGDIASDANILTSQLAEGASFIKKEGTVVYTANQSMGSHRITDLSAPVDPNDAVRKVDLDTLTDRISTGLIYGGALSAVPGGTVFSVAAGRGVITSWAVPTTPTTKFFDFTFSGITPTYLTVGIITYVGVTLDISDTPILVQQQTEFTETQRRSIVPLGAIIHSNLTTINTTNTIGAIVVSSTNQVHDVIDALGKLNLVGNKYTANGANLSFDKSAGTVFGRSINSDWKRPHTLDIAAQTLLTFRIRTRGIPNGATTETADVTAMPTPFQYQTDVVGSPNGLTTIPNNRFGIYHGTLFQSGLTRLQYPQAIYTTIEDAIANVDKENYEVEDNILKNGLFRFYVIVKGNATSLLNTAETRIIESGKFGNVVGNSGTALTLANIIAALGYTPENVANKQNSLVADGTGVKYPTVDAINSALTAQITITTAVSITTLTTVGGLSQHGRNNIIDNGANAINITTSTSSEANFCATYQKEGASAITFVQGAGTTLRQVDGTAILNGAVGSTATLTRFGNVFSLRISNA